MSSEGPPHRKMKSAKRDPGPAWLRSRVRCAHWPRRGVAPCGRPVCPVCGEATIQCEVLHPEPTEEERCRTL
jgi:hypothetical protein